MNAESDGDKGLRELNHRIYDGNKGTTNGVVAEEHVTLEGDDLKANEIMQNVNDGHVGDVQAPTVLQMPQQQPQNAMCYWQKFLHVTTVTVMLVENDDSTRHVVAALLRNCCYEVIEAANVLQAWKILEDLTKHIDLVLAEVGMPFLSGMVLLSKIMSHRTRKNVPVIMMSSQDSMGLVFKCLSKGAADFLLKPIRKNELKNLWQHVWRRCHSSSGSGSESGTQTQKSVKSKSVDKSDNNTGSNDEDDNGSIGLNVGDGSDDGSGTQTSWTKQAVEADSPRPVSPCDQVAECPDSTCAQVIHSNAEVPGNKWAPVTAARWCQERVEQLDNVAMGKDLDIGMPRNVDLQLQRPVEVPIRAVGTKQINLLEMGSSKIHEQIDKRQLDLNSESSSSKLKSEAANQTGIAFTSKTTDLKKESAEYEASTKLFKISDRNETINNSQELSSIELGLKRLRGVKDAGTVVKDERNVLRRSESSAFSRYNKPSNGNKVPIVNIGSSSALDNNLVLTRKGSVCDIRSHLVNDLPNQCSNVGSNNIDMGSTTNNAFAKPAVLKNKSVSSSTDRSSHPSSAFQSTKSDLLSANQKVVLDKADDVTATAGLAQPRGTHQELQMQHPPHHNDQHHHLAHSLQYQQQPPEHDDLSLKKIAADAPHCGSSSVLGEPIEGNAGNYSVNGSASGSNYGSNGPNGSSTAVNTVGTNISDNRIAGKSGSGDASGSGNGSKEDQSKSADREAALTKFRQKRKERCFLEKVTNTVGTNISDNGIARKCGSGDASGSGSKEDQSKSADREAALTKFRQKRKERCFRKKVTNTVGTNISDNGIAGKCGSGDASGSGSRSKEDQSKSADREAALTKFLQKRKVRCFRKKVTNTVGTNISDNRIAGKSGSGDASGSGRKEDQSKSADREAALTKFLQKRKERCFRKKVTNTVGTNKSDNGIAGKSGSGDASGSGSGSGSKEDQSKSAHREAALTKFRQKKKERCCRKKVRYQNRK